MMSEKELGQLSPVVQDALANGLNVPYGQWGIAYPALFQHIARNRQGEKERLSGRLSIYTKPGSVILVVADRENKRVAFLEDDYVEQVLCQGDKSLKDGTIRWKEDPAQTVTVRGFRLEQTSLKW